MRVMWSPTFLVGGPREIAVPMNLTVESAAIQRVSSVVRDVGLEGARLVVASGPGPSKPFGEQLYAALAASPERYLVCGNRREDVVGLDVFCAQHNIEGIIAVGGGRVIDVCKMVARHRNFPVLVVATALSSDCISSPIAVIREVDTSVSVPAQMPVGIIIDLDVVKHCPRDVLLSGLGDLLSNHSASLDWQLAVRAGNDRWDGFADMLSRQAAEQVLLLEPEELFTREGLVRLAEGLVMSGIAMAIAGSSRPCSGSEHLVSHALDQLRLGTGSHGQQVALGVLYVHALREELGLPTVPRDVVRIIRTSGLPTTPEDVGVCRTDFLRALAHAPSTRPGRYSLFSEPRPLEVLERAYQRAFEG